MSRQVLRQAEVTFRRRWDEPDEPVEEGGRRFPGRRFLAQVFVSALLAAVSTLVAATPAGPLDRVRKALVWTVTFEYDFRGKALELQQWAGARGGWKTALAEAWQSGQDRVRSWLQQLRITLPGTQTTSSGQSLRGGATLQWPVKGAVLYGFGWLPPEVGEQFHEGLDVMAPVGSPVVAAGPGVVTRVAEDQDLGLLVEVDHGSITARYAQVSGVRVRVGDQVEAGEQLAVVGEPAGAEREREPHLHFEIHPADGGEPVDPSHYLGLGGSQL